MPTNRRTNTPPPPAARQPEPPQHLQPQPDHEGKTLLPGVNKQSQWARRFYDVVGLYASDQGGEDS